MPFPAPVVPARYYLRLGEVLAQQGIDVGALMRSAGIDPGIAARSDAVLALPQVEALIDAIVARGVRSDFALMLGRQLKVSAHSMVGFGMLSSPTLGDALRFVARYFRLVMPTFAARYRRDERIAELRFTPVAAMSSPCLQFHIEAIAAAAHWEVRALLDGDMPPYQLLLSIPEPAHVAAYDALREAHVQFLADGSPGVRMRLPAEVDRRPLAMADSDALALAEQRCSRLLQEVAQSGRVSDWVRMMLRESSNGMPPLPELARMLNISPRTLDRHLQREGRSYRQLLAEVRTSEAQRLLRDPAASITAIAHELGYADAANFSRAFRRQVGVSPQTWREQHAP